MSPAPEREDRFVRRLRLVGMACALLGVAGAIGVALASPRAMVAGWLAGLDLLIGTALGVVVIVLLHRLTAGRWGVAVRPLAGPASRVLLAAVVLVLPVVVDLGVFAWALPGEHAELHAHRTPWMTPGMVWVRAAAAVGLWAMIGLEAARPLRDSGSRRQGLAAAGEIVILLTAGFISFDWLLSLDAVVSFSSFGLTTYAAGVANGLGLILLVSAWGRGVGPAEHVRGVRRDVAALLLAAVILDFYVSFAQFFIVWNGNLPHQVAWYEPRFDGDWVWLTVAFVAGRYALAVPLLIAAATRRSARLMRTAGALVLVTGAMQAVWMVAPSVEGPVWLMGGGAAAGCVALGGAGVLLGLPAWRGRGRA